MKRKKEQGITSSISDFKKGALRVLFQHGKRIVQASFHSILVLLTLVTEYQEPHVRCDICNLQCVSLLNLVIHLKSDHSAFSIDVEVVVLHYLLNDLRNLLTVQNISTQL